VGKHIVTDQAVAIKVLKAGFDPSVLRQEADMVKLMAGIPSVPAFVHFGKCEKGHDYYVMELFGGEDMKELRDRTRAKVGANEALASESQETVFGGSVPLQVAAYMALQIGEAIKALHDAGFVHRDVKASNFVRRSKMSTSFGIVDFGVARAFKDRDGTLKRRRESAEFRGTTMYASLGSHQGEDQGVSPFELSQHCLVHRF
jgi:tau tubulin kinase